MSPRQIAVSVAASISCTGVGIGARPFFITIITETVFKLAVALQQ
jgi:hypothetical protein